MPRIPFTPINLDLLLCFQDFLDLNFVVTKTKYTRDSKKHHESKKKHGSSYHELHTLGNTANKELQVHYRTKSLYAIYI
jgi:hypothetical protein